MFGKIGSLFGSKPGPSPKAGPQLAMPLFATTSCASDDAVVAAWAEIFPRQPALRVVC